MSSPVVLQNTLVVGVAVLLLSSYLEIALWSHRATSHDTLCSSLPPHGDKTGKFCLGSSRRSTLLPETFYSAVTSTQAQVGGSDSSGSSGSSKDFHLGGGPSESSGLLEPTALHVAQSTVASGNIFTTVVDSFQKTAAGIPHRVALLTHPTPSTRRVQGSDLNQDSGAAELQEEKTSRVRRKADLRSVLPCHSLMRRRVHLQVDADQHLKPVFKSKAGIVDIMTTLKLSMRTAVNEKLTLPQVTKHGRKQVTSAAASVGGEPSQPQTLAQYVEFARNSVDKIKYQLDNLEPLKHQFSDPQWNDVPLKTKAVLMNGERHGVKQVANKNIHPILRKKSFLVGISSVNRRQNYLYSTLKSFFGELDEEERLDIKIIVFNGDVPASNHQDITRVREKFSSQIENDQLEIIDRGTELHEPLRHPENLTLRWGDHIDRVKWRSKQSLDVAYLMKYASSKKHHGGYRYFLMMEDDIKAAKHWAKRCRQWIDSNLAHRTDWTIASFYNPWENVKNLQQMEPFKFFGVIGQVFRVHDLPVVVEFLEKNFDQSPLDWLFVDFLKKFNGTIVVSVPSLFQHEGTVSSLEGKTQSGKSVDFAYEPTYRII